MIQNNEELIYNAYAAFNARDIDKVFTTFHADVRWSNGWEGGYITGHDEIRKYWTRQWKELNPTVDPMGFTEMSDGSLHVLVHQKVKDIQGAVLFDGMVKHIYTFEVGLIRTMDIEKV
jgi:hypothetical protein